jgi:hypothetical protein
VPSSTQPELDRTEHEFSVDAARGAKLLSKVLPYEKESGLLGRIHGLMSKFDRHDNGEAWCEHVYDEEQAIDNVSFDVKFCQILRAGLKDSQLVLLLALLPNLKEIVLRWAASYDRHHLPW